MVPDQWVADWQQLVPSLGTNSGLLAPDALQPTIGAHLEKAWVPSYEQLVPR